MDPELKSSHGNLRVSIRGCYIQSVQRKESIFPHHFLTGSQRMHSVILVNHGNLRGQRAFLSFVLPSNALLHPERIHVQSGGVMRT